MVKQVAQSQLIGKQLKTHIKDAKEHLGTLQIGTPEYAEQVEHLKMLHGMKTRNINKLKEQKAELDLIIQDLEKQEDLRKADKDLLNELRALHSQLTAEEIKAGKIVKDNKK